MKSRPVERPPGTWIQPPRRGFKMTCCDCGLTHRFNFRLVSYAEGKRHTIQFQVFRMEAKDAH